MHTWLLNTSNLLEKIRVFENLKKYVKIRQIRDHPKKLRLLNTSKIRQKYAKNTHVFIKKIRLHVSCDIMLKVRCSVCIAHVLHDNHCLQSDCRVLYIFYISCVSAEWLGCDYTMYKL